MLKSSLTSLPVRTKSSDSSRSCRAKAPHVLELARRILDDDLHQFLDCLTDGYYRPDALGAGVPEDVVALS